MPIGPYVRSKLGRFERPAFDLYRSLFFDLGAFVRELRARAPAPRRVLEIGCGPGVVTELLADAFPAADLTGIDICDAPGKLCRNASGRTQFLKTTSADLRAHRPEPFDLVVMSDVLHHVPPAERRTLLEDSRDLASGSAVVVLKEWVRQHTPAYVLGYVSDRFITGDDIHYMSDGELRELTRNVFGTTSIRDEFRVPPWNCNLALVIAAH
jgi:2-polyprenyl-3-methyl-5-hydroxy-6-metoxy-1,4-benzoquinol methylase